MSLELDFLTIKITSSFSLINQGSGFSRFFPDSLENSGTGYNYGVEFTLEKYYSSVFPWLTRCEKEFGFNLEGYGLKRIYGFLAERYMSFWFQKYTKFKTLPITFKDISDLN